VEHLFAVGSSVKLSKKKKALHSLTFYFHGFYSFYRYDGAVRLFDARKPLSELQRVPVGGGAWRVKWHPSLNHRRMDLLVACMHDGYKVVRFDVNAESLNGSNCDGVVLKHYVIDHGSLGYGVDWSYTDSSDGGGDDGGQETVIVSCSFYDHMLRLWSG
jgi:diphthine methyl ester acylhydrolase